MDLGARFGRRPEVHPLRTVPRRPGDPPPPKRTVPRRPGDPPGHPDHAGASRIRQAGADAGHGEPAGASDGLRDLVHEAREYAAAAVLRGCPPDSAEAARVVGRLLEPVPGEEPVDREELIAGIEAATDPRIDRYQQLTAIINGWPPFPSRMQGDLWLLAALRAHG